MHKSRRTIDSLVREVRKRYLRRVLLMGSAISVLALLVCLAALFFLYTPLLDRPVAFMLAVTVAAGGMAWILAQFLVRPVLRRPSDRQVALFVEERIPDLEDRLNSAVEAAQLGEEPLVDSLFEDAAAWTRRIMPGDLVSRMRERLFFYGSAVGLAAFLVFAMVNLEQIRVTASEINLGELVPQAFMTVSPGDVNIEKGETQQVIASFRNPFDDEVLIAHKLPEGTWTRTPMQPGTDGTSFLMEFFDIQSPIEYYVEADGKRSDLFHISLYEFPAVTSITVTYRYPAYTGLPDRTDEDSGDIRGPRGSRVELTVHATEVATEAAMMLVSGGSVPLASTGPGTFKGSISLEEDDLYTVRLVDATGSTNKFPDQYQIVAVEDAKPRITIRDPGRDTRASPVEEVLIAADAEDDYAVTDFAMRYSVNGEPEEEVDLLAGRSGSSVSGETLLFLEDFTLQPGDVISYYLRARDAFQEEVSDMYFIEVRPFDQSFTQAVNQGAGQQNAQQRQSGLVVNQQEIIAATWRLLRRTDRGADFDAALEALVHAQQTLRDNIASRIETTALSLELRADETQRRLVEYLQEAVSEMETAVEDLADGELQRALTPERRALSNLLRADALNTERQVAQQQQGGMGGGMSATEERMTELMDLELDISRDKYEVQQPGSAAQQSANQQSQELDEAMQRVKDLAQRQQNLVNETNPDQLQGEDRRRFVDRLQRDQEDLRQQVGELTESLQQSGTESMQRRLDRAARNMEEAQRALRRENMSEAMGRQQQALNQLRQLEQDMRVATRGSLRERVEGLDRDIADLAERERELASDISQSVEDGSRDTEALEAERAQIQEEMSRILLEARDMERQAQNQDQELATALRNLQQQAMRGRITDNMRDSRDALRNGWTETADRIEDEILEGLQGLDGPREALAQGLPVSEEEELTRSLADLQALRSELEQLETQSQRAGQGDGRALEARLSRQLSRAREMAERLRQENPGNQAMQRALAGVQNALTRADHTGVLLDEESAEQFFDARFLDPLSELESELLQRLDYLQLARQLYGGRRDDIPPEYRTMVEKYFESLSKQAPSQ